MLQLAKFCRSIPRPTLQAQTHCQVQIRVNGAPLALHTDKDVKHGQRITFTEEADQTPGVEPGVAVLLPQEKEHEVFQRDGNDLHMTYKTGLVAALCRFQCPFKHCDAHQIVVKYPLAKSLTSMCPCGSRGRNATVL